MSGSGNEATSIAAFLIAALVAFVRPKRLGRVSSSDDSFNLTRPSDTAETILMPDVAFVRAGSESPVATLQATDMLDGLDILPGFTYPGAATFRRIAPLAQQRRPCLAQPLRDGGWLLAIQRQCLHLRQCLRPAPHMLLIARVAPKQLLENMQFKLAARGAILPVRIVFAFQRIVVGVAGGVAHSRRQRPEAALRDLFKPRCFQRLASKAQHAG